MIIKVKYTDEESNWVSITFDDNTTYPCSMTDGIRRQYTDAVQEYLDLGNTIEAYVPPIAPAPMTQTEEVESRLGVTLVELKSLMGL